MLLALIRGFNMWMMTEWFKKNHQQSQYINWNNPIQVCSNGHAYYIGQMENGIPATRLSVDYFATYEEAEELMYEGTFEPKTWL